MNKNQQSLVQNLGPITYFFFCVFSIIKWLSPMQWMSVYNSLLKSRGEIPSELVYDKNFASKRGRIIDFYIIGWIFIEITLTIFSSLGIKAHWLQILFSIPAILRIIEIIQVTVNVTLFDSLIRKTDNVVGSRIRMIILAGINYIELVFCFGLIYSTNMKDLIGAQGTISAFYYSLFNQLTIGYGGIYPENIFRLVAGIQGLINVMFIILVFGRYIASFPQMHELFAKEKTME